MPISRSDWNWNSHDKCAKSKLVTNLPAQSPCMVIQTSPLGSAGKRRAVASGAARGDGARDRIRVAGKEHGGSQLGAGEGWLRQLEIWIHTEMHERAML